MSLKLERRGGKRMNFKLFCGRKTCCIKTQGCKADSAKSHNIVYMNVMYKSLILTLNYIILVL